MRPLAPLQNLIELGVCVGYYRVTDYILVIGFLIISFPFSLLAFVKIAIEAGSDLKDYKLLGFTKWMIIQTSKRNISFTVQNPSAFAPTLSTLEHIYSCSFQEHNSQCTRPPFFLVMLDKASANLELETEEGNSSVSVAPTSILIFITTRVVISRNFIMAPSSSTAIHATS
ncbi:hypothetical protein KC324_g73 [Hortaea werneckii]|nr:hypothetical protein KC324_g73 [Hortaea werneckii]